MSETTVFTARQIHTMNPSFPEATAVAVRDGRIIEVGSLEHMQPWLSKCSYSVDDRFADNVLMPGFIDPHLHPSMAAILLPMEFITAMQWNLPWADSQPVRSHEDFMATAARVEAKKAPDEPLFIWGYHQLWHGKIRRAELNSISTERPVIVWHRSFHEMYLNDKALEWLDLTPQRVGNALQVDLENGHFFESGKAVAMRRLNPYLLEPERFREGLARLREVVHAGGHTTIGDMAVGIMNLELEWPAMLEILDADDVPFRTECIARGAPLGPLGYDIKELRETVDSLVERNTHRLRFAKRVKLFCDGAFFSQLAQMKPPGYLNGTVGEWMMTPEALEAVTREYWNDGYRIHVHSTGDLGLDLILDILERLQFERPRFNHGFTIEHFGFSTPEQVDRMAVLGVNVSCNVYYLYELSGIYSREGIGYERASQMARVGSTSRAGITTTFHSDFTMAPARPLNHAWVAANRINAEGDVMAPQERMSVEQAMRAITIDAARVLDIADDVGSIRAGKRADFTILDDDPYVVGAEGLRDLQVLATVFEGTVYEIGESKFKAS
jgi:predicted amidohydrolase YtcJ